MNNEIDNDIFSDYLFGVLVLICSSIIPYVIVYTLHIPHLMICMNLLTIGLIGILSINFIYRLIVKFWHWFTRALDIDLR